jgi:hypothetical protein
MTTGLTVVVASTRGADGERCAAALAAELGDGDEVIWVGADPPPTSSHRAITVTSGSRGVLYRAGLDAASCPFVAFTDASTLIQPGWRHAAVGALRDGALAVGGPVLPAATRPLRCVAGFAVEYGPHAVAPFSNATGDVAANNVAYERAELRRVLSPGEPVWKAAVDRRLAAGGQPAVIEERMRVVSTKSYGWTDLLGVRVHHGRQHGAQQALRQGRVRRLVHTVGSPIVPFVAYGRLARRIAPSRELRRPFLLASPLVLAALIAWSCGEATGLWTARGPASDVF